MRHGERLQALHKIKINGKNISDPEHLSRSDHHSRLRQEGEFTITSKSTFQRRITSNHHWLPTQLLYYRHLFHISCHSNSCICVLFWNTHIHNRICSWFLEPSVESIVQSLIVKSLTHSVWTYFPKKFDNSSLTSRTTELLLIKSHVADSWTNLA